MKISKTLYPALAVFFMFTMYLSLSGFDDGIVGFTKKNGNTVGCVCHGFDPNNHVSVTITGPSSVAANDSATFTLTISGGPDVAGGCDISTSLGNVYTSHLDTSLRRAESFPGSGFELTHKDPKLFIGGILEFTFKYVAPPVANVVDTIFANGNSVNHDTTPENDQWNYAESFLVTIVDNPLPVELASFTAVVSGNNAELKWSTSSEQNNSGFSIERFLKQEDWKTIGFVNGHGNSNTNNDYSFTDKNLLPGKYNYRLKQIDYNGNFHYYNLSSDVNISPPNNYTLFQNYPNPFNPQTVIVYQLPVNSFVSLKVFDLSGKEVSALVNQNQNSGTYSVDFNGSNFSSGIYFYTLKVNEFTQTKKMILMK